MRPRRGTVYLLAILAAVGAVIAVASGWRGALVFAFLAALAWAIAFGASVGGAWLEDRSRTRFERRDR